MIKTDALIIGKGPAGIQASLYLKRANMDPIIIGKDRGASAGAHKIDNFYGVPGIGGVELIETGIQQAENLGIKLEEDEVVSINYENGFIVHTTKKTYKTQTVLMATGANRNIPRIRKIRTFEGKGVSYCAVCDAYFFKDKTLGVLGAGEYAVSEYEVLREITNDVTVFTNGEEVTGIFPEGTKFNTERIKSVYGDEKLEGLELRSQEKISLNGLFVAIGVASSTDLAQKLGVEIESGRVIVDEHMSTIIPGLYAAGDCTPGVQQIAKAVGDGCVAGMNMVSYIRNLKRGLKL